ARVLLGIVFVFITAPVAGHLNGRAAYRTDVPLWEQSVQDELEPLLKGKKVNHEAKDMME
ncbi:monovalent cation/H(+) antiporter subunit G, partial [Paenibacillus tundrae]